MTRPGEGQASNRRGSVSLMEFGVIGLGLCLLAGVSGAGCGIGTENSAVTGPDGATVSAPDAETGTHDAEPPSTLPDGIPPIDQLTYENTEIATFALG